MQLETMSDADLFCKSCVYVKATRKSISQVREGECAMEFGGKTHSDMWGPAPVETKGEKHYYITYTDDKTWFTNLYLLAKKSKAFKSYKDYKAWCSTQLNTRIKTLHSDQGENIWGRNSYYI
jgi:hypothetical protein